MKALPFALFALLCASASAELIPVSRLVDWTPGTRTGVIGGIPSRSTIADDGNANGITDSLESIDDTGATDVRAEIQAAIDEASVGEIVRMPTGTFRVDGSLVLGTGFSGKTFRGAGATTIIDAHCTQPLIAGSNSGYSAPTPALNVTSGLEKGSTTITVGGDLSNISPGSIVMLMVENDPSIPVVSVYNYDVHTNQAPQGQVVRVSAKDGDELTFFPPMHDDYGGGDLEVRVIPQTFSASGIGLEDFVVDCTSYEGGSGGSYSGILMAQCYNSWIKNVKAVAPLNYAIVFSQCINSEIRRCYAGELKGSGTNGAGLLFSSHSCLIEDNIFVDAFPNIEVNAGSAGNAFLYNYGNGACNTNHAPHNQFNLHEGNAWNHVISDGYFGSESDLTIYRCYMWSELFGTVHMRRFSRRFSVVGCIIDSGVLGSDGYPNIGNTDSNGTAQLSMGDPWRDYQMTGILTTRTSDTGGVITLDSGMLHGGNVQVIRLVWGAGLDQQRFAHVSSVDGDEATIVDYVGGTALPTMGTVLHIGPGAFYGNPGEGSYQELDLDVAATLVEKGNYSLATETMSSLGGDTLTNSLCSDSKAASEARGVVWGNLAYPPFDPANPSTADVERIPAGYRFMNAGADPPEDGNVIPVVNIDTLNVGTP